MATAYIDFGSSIDPETNILRAVRELARVAAVTGISTFYRSPAVDRPGDPDFCNGTVRVKWEGSADDLKKACGRIETDLGRVRTADRFAPRVIDLDILLFDDLVSADPALTVPDPHINERAFLSLALYELDPGLVIPGSGTPLSVIADRADRTNLITLTDFTAHLRKDALP